MALFFNSVIININQVKINIKSVKIQSDSNLNMELWFKFLEKEDGYNQSKFSVLDFKNSGNCIPSVIRKLFIYCGLKMISRICTFSYSQRSKNM